MRALVLTAGFGTRLGALTTDCPKPLLEADGVTLVELVLANLRRQGIVEVALNLHFAPEALPAHLGDGEALGMRLAYSHEAELLGTAGALRPLGDWLTAGGGDDFLVHYGDVITDQDFAALGRTHVDRGAEVTMLVHERPGSNSVATLAEDWRVESFLERPDPELLAEVGSSWAFSGVCRCAPTLLERLPDRVPLDLPGDVFPGLAAAGSLFAAPLDAFRVAVDSPDRLEAVRQALRAGRLPPAG
jgi:NDP-sugar pyrophosphorylase family protein